MVSELFLLALGFILWMTARVSADPKQNEPAEGSEAAKPTASIAQGVSRRG
jgi:hypothetical protein